MALSFQALSSILLAIGVSQIARAESPGPAYAPLEKAYEALRAKDYEPAIAGFRQALALDPARAAIHIDLAYTLLKVGENDDARDQFAAALRLEPSNNHIALEYAFLCYESHREAEARRIFDRVRKTGDAVAEQAFQNVDRPLGEGIARWRKALELSPDNFSAHQELANLAEQRGELELAAEHYESALRLRPEERGFLLDLGRVWKLLGRNEEAGVALIGASRGASPRVAEKARELLPARYPYVYEFERALQLDPKNLELRRELAYLLLEMDRKPEAEQHFQMLHDQAPADLLSAAQLGFLLLNRRDLAGAQPLLDQALNGGDDEIADRVRTALKLPRTLRGRPETPPREVSNEAKDLAAKSLKAGYLKDALRYLTVAHENDPIDFAVMLKLAWVYNILHRDEDAIRWFNLARKSPDGAIAAEAERAYNNLRPGLARVRTTAWINPFFSSRWRDAFGYGQVKTEFRIGRLPFRPYLSARFIGDVRQTAGSTLGNPQPQYLSESSFIFAVGVSSAPWRGITAWGEAGEAVKYLASRKDVGAAIPDYRAGLSYGKGFGHLLNGSKGLFFETNDDAVFVSRFQRDALFYSQNRTGYTLAPFESLGGVRAQVYWNWNGTADRLRQYWANFVETGPGVRIRFDALPKSMLFSVNVARGVYTVNQYNPRRPNFFDIRAAFWYAFTR